MRVQWKVAGLLFCSGACALIYQTVWIRQFRLVFGASTGATAAVLAIFMAGLGIGSATLGRRADAAPNPLRLYAILELLIAAASALTQPLLWLIAKIYFATGGSVTLGLFAASVVRLVLASVVLVAPTILMGGTLPAAARAVGRRHVALLYGANTLGAVAGTLLSTFLMLEAFGNRWTLFAAVAVNVVIAVMASSGAPPLPAPIAAEGRGAPQRIYLIAAAIVGFAFLLMELVWYRMLAPLLGGSTFTFGLILAVALLGIGLGGVAYSLWGRATRSGFALTCALEALALAIPFALGDKLAVFELYLRSLGAIGFSGFVMAWAILTLIVVFPAAFISGIQFPLLIALLGEDDEGVGRDVGAAYAWNTAGAIAGSIAGGFGLLPLLTAPGAWRLVIVVLAVLSVLAARRIVASTIAIAAIAATFALGPTAVWRHSGIGAGRADEPKTINARVDWMHRVRRTLVWEADGRESSVALIDIGDYAFVVNGKVDGSARGDAGTQVMAGLVPAILHPRPQHALVVGLGTGSSAGWLGSVSGMQRVDVVELEPAVLRVARACAPVNRDVLRNPKVRIRIGDAREVLLATRESYDIIFSEPSNPYRAGIASLFTQEFYRASAARLNAGGIFAQWLQAYDVDAQTIRTIYATLGSVFAHVETWTTDEGDVLLVATREPIRYDFDALRRRVASEPFRTALHATWRVESLEGFLSHFLGRDSMARAVAMAEHDLSTDDRTLVEFGFARGLDVDARFSMDELTSLARLRGEDRPIGSGAIDIKALAANRASMSWTNALFANASDDDRARHRVAEVNDNLAEVAEQWRVHAFAPANSRELATIGEALAETGSTAAEAYAEQLRAWNPVDADAILARLRYRQGRLDESSALLQRVLIACRTNAWASSDLITRMLDLVGGLGTMQMHARPLLGALEQPFAAGQWNDTRLVHQVLIAHRLETCGARTLRALRALEPWPPWREDILKMRRDCYQTSLETRAAARAQRDLDRFNAAEAMPFNRGLVPAPSSSPP